MTTAARPTFDTARGGQGQRERDLSAISKQYSSRDLPSHTSLKSRDRGQSGPDDLRERDLRRELQERERAAAGDRRREKQVTQDRRPQIEAAASAGGASSSKKARPSAAESASAANLDADDPVESGEEDSDSSDDDDDDDDALLMAELQKIKAEKAQEEAEKEEERRAEDEKIRMENILTGNPLLKDKYAAAAAADKSDMKVRKRWDDDVVFKNCSRAEPEQQEKRFINDSLRSDFHRKFMDKYIK